MTTMRDGTPITCDCGRHELCLDGKWRGRVYRDERWELMRDGAKRCVCGTKLEDKG